MLTDVHGEAKLIILLAAALYAAGTVVEDCEDAWNETAGTGVTATADSAVKVVGTNSAKFVMTSAAIVGLLASEAVTLNLTTKKKLGLYIRPDIYIPAGALQLLLDDTALCASPLETLNLPELKANAWNYVVLTLADPSLLAAVISIGIKQTIDLGAFTLNIDQVESFAYEPMTGVAVDIKDYIGRGKLLLAAAAPTAGTTPTLDVKLQESDDQYSGFADISGATFTQLTTAGATQEKPFLIDSRKRWIRAIPTLGGSAGPAYPLALYLLAPKQEL